MSIDGISIEKYKLNAFEFIFVFFCHSSTVLEKTIASPHLHYRLNLKEIKEERYNTHLKENSIEITMKQVRKLKLSASTVAFFSSRVQMEMTLAGATKIGWCSTKEK